MVEAQARGGGGGGCQDCPGLWWAYLKVCLLRAVEDHVSSGGGRQPVLSDCCLKMHLFMHYISCSFLVKHPVTQVSQAPYISDLAPFNFWLFPKLNHLWEGRDFRPWMRFKKIWPGSWWQLGELCEVPRCLLWRGLRDHCPMFLLSSSINVSIFHITWFDTFWIDLVCTHSCTIHIYELFMHIYTTIYNN